MNCQFITIKLLSFIIMLGKQIQNQMLESQICFYSEFSGALTISTYQDDRNLQNCQAPVQARCIILDLSLVNFFPESRLKRRPVI